MENKDPSKTELPSQRVIDDARRDGNVMNSTELNSLVVVFGSTLLLFWTFSTVNAGFNNIYQLIMNIDCRGSWNTLQISHGAWVGGTVLSEILLLPMIGICIIAITINRIQVGHYLEFKPLVWKFDSMNPVSGMKKILPSLDNTVKLLLVLAKVSVIAVFVYFAIRSDLNQIVTLPLVPLEAGVSWVMRRTVILILKILMFFTIVAILDFIWKKRRYTQKLMMTKQEVKDERKNAEGDPAVKGRLRQKMRELTMMRMIVEVPKADVVITNPIHVAIALRYEPGAKAPKVVARGLRKRAARIKAIAAAADVPIIEEPPLARALYKQARLGGFIPPELFGAVAAILARLHHEGKRQFV